MRIKLAPSKSREHENTTTKRANNTLKGQFPPTSKKHLLDYAGVSCLVLEMSAVEMSAFSGLQLNNMAVQVSVDGQEREGRGFKTWHVLSSGTLASKTLIS